LAAALMLPSTCLASDASVAFSARDSSPFTPGDCGNAQPEGRSVAQSMRKTAYVQVATRLYRERT
jgi:hypothetical protein